MFIVTMMQKITEKMGNRDKLSVYLMQTNDKDEPDWFTE